MKDKDSSRNISLALDEYFDPQKRDERKLQENRKKRAKVIKEDSGL